MKKNKKILLASVLATGFVFGGAMALNANVASAASNFDGIDFSKVVMSDGASVRVSADVNDTNYGIRFQMNMDEATYNTLETRGANYGVAIFPADYNYEISESAIFATESKATFVESETLSDSNKDGTYDMWGSLVNIKPANVTREFVGIGYVELNGEYKLANAYGGDIANNTRSIYYVSQLAVDNNDPKADVAKETYIDTFDTAGKQYAYTVEHVYKKDGEVVKTETTTEYGTLNTKVSATAKTSDVFYKAENATAESTLYANGNTTLTLVYNDSTVATTYNAEYVQVSGGNITLDLTKFADMPTSAEKVFVDGAEVSATSTGTQVTVPVTAGELEIAIYDGEACYVADVIAPDYLISDQATLKAWGSKDNRANIKYAVLTTDIVCDGSDLMMYDGKPTYTLNGLGHKVTGAYYSNGIFTNAQTQVGFAMKNITFEGMILDTPYYALFGCYAVGGLYENVNISATYTKFPNYGLLFNEMNGSNGGMSFRNCNFIFTVPEADTDKVARLYNDSNGHYGTYMENVTIISNGRIAGVGELSEGHTTPGVTHGHATRGDQSIWTNVTILDKDDMEVLTSSEKGVLMTDGKITLDTTKFAKSVNFDDVIVGATSVDYTLSGNTLIVPVSSYGETNILLVDSTANKLYTLTVTVADYLISDQTTFKNWGLRIKEGYKYLILTQDIVCDGSDLTVWNGTYDATLDGMGYTVTNANYGYGIFNSIQPTNAVIKNITFENMKLAGTSHYYSFGGAWTKGVVFENVNVSATYETSNTIKGLIFADMGNTNPIILRNCNFNFTVPEAQADTEIALYNDANGAYSTTMENVTIMANCKIADVNHSTDSWTNVTILDKDDMTALTTSEKYAKLTAGNATLDLTKLSATVAVSGVMVNGMNVEYSVVENNLTFATSAGVQNVYIVDATANKLYTMEVKVADVVITNFSELKTFWESTEFNTSKYAVIANNIICEDTQIASNETGVKSGVIDGLGNTITNMTIARGIFFKVDGATLKDITFESFNYQGANTWYGRGLVAHYSKNSVYENVTMTTKLSADYWMKDGVMKRDNLLGHCDSGGSYGYKFVGCNFQIDCDEAMKATAMSVAGEMWYYCGSFTDTTVTYAGTLNLEKDFTYNNGANVTYSNATFTDMTGTYTK